MSGGLFLFLMSHKVLQKIIQLFLKMYVVET